MKKIIVIILVSILFFSIASFENVNLYVKGNNQKKYVFPNEGKFFAVSDSGDLGDSWPMFRHDPQHTGYSTSDAPETNNVLWSFEAGAYGYVYSSPAVINNKVYIGANDRNVYCLDALNGSKIWEYQTGGNVQSSPAIYEDKVYVGSSDHKIYCLNALNGSKIWEYQTGDSVAYSPAVYNGKIYIGSSDNNIYCLNAENGSKIWNFTTGNFISNSPAISEGKVYIGSGDKKLYCLDALNGSKIWEFLTDAPNGFKSSPTVYDGKVYIGGIYMVHCLRADNGIEAWNSSVYSSSVISSPAVVNGKVYIGGGKKLICFNASNGSELWSYTTGGAIDTSSPAVADGKIYIGSGDYNVYCLNAENGSKIWQYATEYMVRSSPAVTNGYVYIGSLDKKVYCFGEIIETNQPPNKPARPIGTTEGEVDVEYTFATTTSDPEGDQIYYWFDWGDNTDSGWITASSKSHSWGQEGIYQIKVKAKDIHGEESRWSNSLTVDIVEPTQEAPKEQQFIFGTVLDDSGTPIEGVRVCAIIDDTTSKCKVTGDQGAYYISVSTGTYTVVASKDGYYTSTKYDIVVEAKQAIQTDFILSRMDQQETEVQGDVNEQILQAAIDAAREDNKLGAEINIQQTIQEIITYRDIEVEFLEQTKDKLSFNIEGEGSGAIIVISIGERQLSNINNIEVTYDGIPIEMGNIASIFNLEGDTPYYGILITRNEAGDLELNVILYSPHFSEHTITITSIIEAIGGTTAIIMYIVIAMIAVIVFMGRFYLRPVYLTYFRKKRQ